MRRFVYACVLLLVSTAAFGATGAVVTYEVNGQPYEGYFVSPSKNAPFLLLIHDWDGLTDYEVKRADMRALMMGAMDTARGKGANTGNAVAFGYCFGGAAVLELARSGADLKGFATFHGGLKTPQGQNYAQARGKILVMHGSADKAISMDQFAGLTKELESAGVVHEMITYGGAPHAFTVFGSTRYREAADKSSWMRFTEFLAENLK